MRKRKKRQSQCANWLDTYSDMVTLLLTFFVLLYSMTTMNESKWKKLVQAFQSLKGNPVAASTLSIPSQIGTDSSEASSAVSIAQVLNSSKVTKVTNFDDLYPYFKQYIEKNHLQSEITLYKGNDYTFLSLRNSIFFDGDSAVLKSDGKKILDFFCDALSGIPNQVGEIRFYGHTAQITPTDTAERQAFDRGLSDDRAKNVLLYVQSKKIISGAKMQSTGYGMYRPVAKNDTEAGRAKNRRVEIYISKTGHTEDVLQKVYQDIQTASSSPSAGTSISPGSADSGPKK